MKRLILTILLVLSPLARAEEFAVVVASNSSISMLDMARLKSIFLRQSSFEGGTRLVPVNLLGEDNARIEFEMRVLMMERDELNRYWITSHFQGLKPPATQASLDSMKAFILRVDGAIGYLPLSMVDQNLRVVYEF
jgi:hypothetical protein